MLHGISLRSVLIAVLHFTAYYRVCPHEILKKCIKLLIILVSLS